MSAPDAPVLSAEVIAGGNTARLTWTEPATATEYRVERKLGAGAYADIEPSTVETSLDDTPVAGDYTYRAYASNGDGESIASNAVALSIGVAFTAPEFERAVKVGEDTVKVIFRPVTAPVGYVLDRYQLEVDGVLASALLTTVEPDGDVTAIEYGFSADTVYMLGITARFYKGVASSGPFYTGPSSAIKRVTYGPTPDYDTDPTAGEKNQARING